MLSETDVRNKDKVIERKSLYSQLQKQLEQMKKAMKDRDGTIETLQRQLVQAGIKDKVNVGEMEVRKDVLQTKAEQKFYRRLLDEDRKNNLQKSKEKE